MTNDIDPFFISEFYTNLRILSQDLYKKFSTVHYPVGNGAQADIGSRATDENLMLNSGIIPKFNRRVGHIRSNSDLNLQSSLEKTGNSTSESYYSPQALQERIKQYSKQGRISTDASIPMDYFSRYAAEDESKVSAFAVIGRSNYEKK